MAIDITAQVQPIVTQAVRDAAQSFEARLSALETQVVPVVSAEVATVVPQLGTTLVATAAGISANALHDVWIPRVIVGGCAAAALAILIGYEAGSHQAADIVAYIAPLLVVVFGLASRMLVSFFTGNVSATPPTPGA